MSEAITVTPIGTVHSEIREPRDQVFGGLIARVELDPARYAADSLRGLDEFSHVEIFFYFHQLEDAQIVYTTRHPCNRPDWPEVGIFAQRARARPSRIGSTVCRLVAVEGLTITVEELDAIDGTPVLDIKPWMSVLGPRGPVREPAWARELSTTYWRPAK